MLSRVLSGVPGLPLLRICLVLYACLALRTVYPTPASTDHALPSIVHRIDCAVDSEQAAIAIGSLAAVRQLPPGLPSESESPKEPYLQAATLDKLLATLYRSYQKYPVNKNLIERVVIRWNYCSVIDRGTYFDHRVLDDTTIRTPTIRHADRSWQGFTSFGLTPHPNKDNTLGDSFRFNTPYMETSIRSLADRRLQQRYIAHCLPHPDDGHLYRDYGKNFIDRLAHINNQPVKFEPLTWIDECGSQELKITDKPKAPLATDLTEKTQVASVDTKPEERVTTPIETVTTKETDPATMVVVPEVHEVAQAAALPEVSETHQTTAVTESPELRERSETPEAVKAVDVVEVPTTPIAPENSAAPDLAAANPSGLVINPDSADLVIAEAPDTKTPHQPARDSSISRPGMTESTVVPIEDIKESSSQTESLAPIVITGPATGNSIASTNASRSTGLSGSVSLENRSFRAKDTSLKLAFAYKPIEDSYWFIRSSFNISQESKPLTYSWGIGYDDWHAGTWALQLNHWGPLRPGDGLDFKNSVADLSYKFDKDWLKSNNMSSSISLTKPLSNDASLNWGWSWSPFSHWFVRSTLTKPLGKSATGKSGLDWSYGFGYTRYDSDSFSFEYNNWGVNKFPSHNFRKNGQLSLIYRWAF